MARLKKIDVFSFTRLVGFLAGAVGLIAGILYSFGGLIIDSSTSGLNYGTILAFGALIGMPIIFAIPGLIAGAILALLYNLVAKHIGGIEVDLEQ